MTADALPSQLQRPASTQEPSVDVMLQVLTGPSHEHSRHVADTASAAMACRAL